MSRLELSDVELSELAALKAISVTRRRSVRRSVKRRAADAAVLGLVAAVGGQSLAAAADELDQELIDSLAGLNVVDDLSAFAAGCDPVEQYAGEEHLHNGQSLASYMRHDAPFYLNDPFASRFASRFGAEHDGRHEGHEGALPGEHAPAAHEAHAVEGQHAAAGHEAAHEGAHDGAHDGHETAGEGHAGHDGLAGASSHEEHEDEANHEAHASSAHHASAEGHASGHDSHQAQSAGHGDSGHDEVSAHTPAVAAADDAGYQDAGDYHAGSGVDHAASDPMNDALADLDIEEKLPAAAPGNGHDHGPTMADMDLPPAEDLAAASHHHVV